jgi:hypothetical protein
MPGTTLRPSGHHVAAPREAESRFFANARPECDFRYFSNSSALYLSGKAQYQINSQGLNLEVCADLPALWSEIRRFRSAVAPIYSCSGEFTLRMMYTYHIYAPARRRPSGYAGHHASPFRPSRGCATRSPKGEAWWSQAGSNRRPRHCERRALPAELWPLVRAPRRKPRRPTIGAIYNPRQGQVKNGETGVFSVICRELPLFAREGTDI